MLSSRKSPGDKRDTTAGVQALIHTAIKAFLLSEGHHRFERRHMCLVSSPILRNGLAMMYAALRGMQLLLIAINVYGTATREEMAEFLPGGGLGLYGYESQTKPHSS